MRKTSGSTFSHEPIQPHNNKAFLLFVGDALQNKIMTTKTMKKKGPSPEVARIMKKNLKLEYDFYNFVKNRFDRLKFELQSSIVR